MTPEQISEKLINKLKEGDDSKWEKLCIEISAKVKKNEYNKIIEEIRKLLFSSIKNTDPSILTEEHLEGIFKNSCFFDDFKEVIRTNIQSNGGLMKEVSDYIDNIDTM